MLKSMTIRLVFDWDKFERSDDSILPGDPESIPAGELVDALVEAMNEAEGLTAHLITYSEEA